MCQYYNLCVSVLFVWSTNGFVCVLWVSLSKGNNSLLAYIHNGHTVEWMKSLPEKWCFLSFFVLLSFTFLLLAKLTQLKEAVWYLISRWNTNCADTFLPHCVFAPTINLYFFSQTFSFSPQNTLTFFSVLSPPFLFDLELLTFLVSFFLLSFSVLPPFFRHNPTDSTLPPIPSCHSPSCPLPHHPFSPSAGTRPNKRRWESCTAFVFNSCNIPCSFFVLRAFINCSNPVLIVYCLRSPFRQRTTKPILNWF